MVMMTSLLVMSYLICHGYALATHSPLIRFPVYIESTDAFGVAFHATYPVLIERAINQHTGKTEGRLRHVKLMRFRSAARLGDVMLFESSGRGSLRLISEETKEEHFSAKGVELTEDSLGIGRSAVVLPSHQLHISKHSLYPDEYYPSNDGAALLLHTRTVFNLLERGRTDALGGPRRLRLAAASSRHIYIARISDYERVFDIPTETPPSASFPEVAVLTQSELLGDTMVDFTQQLVFGAGPSGDHGRLLARARVTCCSVDAMTGKPLPFGEELRNTFLSQR